MKFLDKILHKGAYQKESYDTHHKAGSTHDSIRDIHMELFELKQTLMFQANQEHLLGHKAVNWSQIAKDEARLAELKAHKTHGKFFTSKPDTSVAGGESLHELYNDCSELMTFVRKEKSGAKPVLEGHLAQEMQHNFGADGSVKQAQNFTNNPSVATAGVAGAAAAALGAATHGGHYTANDTTGRGHQVGDDHTTAKTGMGLTGHREQPHTGARDTTGAGRQIGDDHTTAKTGLGVTGHREQPHGVTGQQQAYGQQGALGQQQAYGNQTAGQQHAGLATAAAAGVGAAAAAHHHSSQHNDTTGMGRQVGDNHTTANTGMGVTGHREQPHAGGIASATHGGNLNQEPTAQQTYGQQYGNTTQQQHHINSQQQSGAAHPSMMDKAKAAVGLGAAGAAAHHHNQTHNDTTGAGRQVGEDHTTAKTGMGLTGHREQPHLAGQQGLGQQGAYAQQQPGFAGQQQSGHHAASGLAAAGAGLAAHEHNKHATGAHSHTGQHDTTGMGRQVGDNHTTANTGLGASGHKETPGMMDKAKAALGMGAAGTAAHHNQHGVHTGQHDTTDAGRQIGDDHTTQRTGMGVTGHREEPHLATQHGVHNTQTGAHPSMMDKAKAAVGLGAAGAAAHHGSSAHSSNAAYGSQQPGAASSTHQPGMLQQMLHPAQTGVTGAQVSQQMHGQQNHGINSFANELESNNRQQPFVGQPIAGQQQAAHPSTMDQAKMAVGAGAGGAAMHHQAGQHTGQHDTTGMGRQVGDNHTTANTGMGVTGHREQPHLAGLGQQQQQQHGLQQGSSAYAHTGPQAGLGGATAGHQLGSDHTTAYTGQGMTGHKETPSTLGGVLHSSQGEQGYSKQGGLGQELSNDFAKLSTQPGGVTQQHQSGAGGVLTGQHSEIERARQAELERNAGY